ncbi:MAG: (Fe-S)-binding protein, partial [Methylocystaceae bacterium]
GAHLMAEKKSTDILFWTGCFGTYNSRNQQVTQAMINILKQASADFAVMGSAGKCCGDTARRLGNELLFRQLALANIETLNGYKFNTIITACPHCYNTLKNEYPELGGSYKVLHHSEFILQLIEAGRIKLQAGENIKVTFHDPCYLGRYNGRFEAPRQVLASIPGIELAEMRNIKNKSHCCGAGGGLIWLENNHLKKISALRAREAVKVKPDIVVNACPLCLGNLSDAVGSLEPGIKNLDIAEMINDALIERQ